MDKTTFKKLALMSILLLFIYGCGSGGGNSLASLFGGGSSGGDGGSDGITISGELPGDGSGGGGEGGGGDDLSLLSEGGEGLPSVHHPEPATMLLLGTGIAAMGIFRKRNKKR